MTKDEILKADQPPDQIIDVEGISPDLIAVDRWVLWRWNHNGKKWTKVPCDDAGFAMDAQNPSNWRDFATVNRIAEQRGYGIGFVFNGDGVNGIDLDDCRDPETGVIAGWAQDFVRVLASFTEVSPSGTGLKIFVRGEMPAQFDKQYTRPEGGETEVYATGRFFTVTGQRVDGTPFEVRERSSKIAMVLKVFEEWKPEKPAPVQRQHTAIAVSDPTDDRKTVLAAFDVLDPNMPYDKWLDTLMAAHSVDQSESMMREADNWSRGSDKYVDGEVEQKWKSFSASSGVTIATLCYMADQTGQKWRPERPIDRDIDLSGILGSGVDAEPEPDLDEMPPWVEEECEPEVEQNPTRPNESANDPHRLARLYLRQNHTRRDGTQTLVYHQGEYQLWDGQRYQSLKNHCLHAMLTASIKAEFNRVNLWMLKRWVPKKEGELPPKVEPVTKSLLNNVVNAVSSITIQPDSLSMPDWLSGDPPFPAREVLATPKALLHLPSLFAGKPATVKPTPMFYSQSCLSYEYDPLAVCPHWMAFLKSIWGDDPESILTLQEFIGYLLLPKTDQHKLMMLIGPARGGKGSIMRTIQLLIGEGNVASPTLSSLAGPFGLWPLLGKFVGLIPDARLSGRDDSIAIVERLLSLTGEDPQDVHRKSLPTLTGVRMPIRFVLASNELPNLRDASGAFMTRVLLLRMTQSFTGREDRTLEAKLRGELPGILNWAIEGWKRLTARGYFVQPESANELITDLENLSSPIRQFIADACYTGPGHEASVESLFTAWSRWCEQHHREHIGTTQTLGKDLRAALPSLKGGQRRDGESRLRVYEGIGVRIDW